MGGGSICKIPSPHHFSLVQIKRGQRTPNVVFPTLRRVDENPEGPKITSGRMKSLGIGPKLPKSRKGLPVSSSGTDLGQRFGFDTTSYDSGSRE